MSDTVIKVENLGKLYKLGEIGTGTLSHDLNRWWAAVRGKEDPFSRVGQTNKRNMRGDDGNVWALRDITFEVKQGEVLGIIGRNGAGKSTLLKILSKITTPSTGQISIKGRIASLLEVGTGFHPELTGRENVFLNGAILGMTRSEIRSKFEEIVDFAGVARYIDTPVKRYSSGMYVRLAFSVAAFLESDILIVDEVLAVGDAEFQDRCIGKMREISGSQSRCVIFVSHDLSAIQSLTTNSIILEAGSLTGQGLTGQIVKKYINSLYDKDLNIEDYRLIKSSDKKAIIMDVQVKKCNEEAYLTSGKDFQIDIFVCVFESVTLDAAVVFEDSKQNPLYTTHLSDSSSLVMLKKGNYRFTVNVNPSFYRTGNYFVSLALFSPNRTDFYEIIHHIPLLKIIHENELTYIPPSTDERWGDLFINYSWEINKHEKIS